ncbi:MAG TPA: hypothetical protein PLI01_00340 [Nitrospira sp.]|nr:hypothetical protein [Nitrospira sp.]HNA25207.1 hypothetical protein [Nitrospira sp.]HNI17497.1 hypothetical protein [Nitrospira sp.]
MKKILYSLLTLFSVAIMVIAGGVQYANSQTLSPGGGTGVLQPGLFYLKNGAILTTNPAYTIGSATNPIAAGYFTFLSAATASISGIGTGDMLPSANNTFSLGSATRTWANLYLGTNAYVSGTINTNNLIWTNATGTNTTSTNLFATRLLFTNATGSGALQAQSVSSTSATTSWMTITSKVGNSGKINITNSNLNCAASQTACIRTDTGAMAISAGTGGAQLYFNIDNVGGTSSFYGNILPDNTTRNLGSLTLPWNLFAGSVSSTSVTSTKMYIGNSPGGCASLTGGVVGIASQGTGFYINASHQIQFCTNGNTGPFLDPGEGWFATNVVPLSTGTGNVGSSIRVYGQGWFNHTTGTDAYYSQGIAIAGTSTQATSTNYTINATNFSFKFPAAATSVIINDSFVRGTTSTHVQVTIADLDATMFYAQVTTTAVGQIRVRAPAAPTADTKVNVLIINER